MDNQKITSLRRQEASRRNGALSNGPITPEGKARSSRNAVTHGCLATLITFNAEEADLFNRIHAEYVARFEPRDQAEHDLVEEIVRAKWQIRQAWAYESATVGLQLVQDAERIDRIWKSLGETDRRTLALTASLKDSNTIPNLQRYARSLALQAERDIKLLMALKIQPLPPAEEPAQKPSQEPLESAERNEPSPISGHPGPIPNSRAACTIHAYAITPAAPRILATPLKHMTAGA